MDWDHFGLNYCDQSVIYFDFCSMTDLWIYALVSDWLLFLSTLNFWSGTKVCGESAADPLWTIGLFSTTIVYQKRKNSAADWFGLFWWTGRLFGFFTRTKMPPLRPILVAYLRRIFGPEVDSGGFCCKSTRVHGQSPPGESTIGPPQVHKDPFRSTADWQRTRFPPHDSLAECCFSAVSLN